MRKLMIIGAIDEDNYSTFCNELIELEKNPNKRIDVELCSNGGDTYVGLAYYGRIRQSPCDIHVTVYGYCMSAASIILAGADYRVMHKDAWFMVHDDDSKVRENSAKTAAIQYEHYDNLEWQWADILSRHSNLSPDELRAMSKDTTYLTAEDCLKNGLIDKVLE